MAEREKFNRAACGLGAHASGGSRISAQNIARRGHSHPDQCKCRGVWKSDPSRCPPVLPARVTRGWATRLAAQAGEHLKRSSKGRSCGLARDDAAAGSGCTRSGAPDVEVPCYGASAVRSLSGVASARRTQFLPGEASPAVRTLNGLIRVQERAGAFAPAMASFIHATTYRRPECNRGRRGPSRSCCSSGDDPWLIDDSKLRRRSFRSVCLVRSKLGVRLENTKRP